MKKKFIATLTLLGLAVSVVGCAQAKVPGEGKPDRKSVV